MAEKIDWSGRILQITIVAATVALPLIILPGSHDQFRRPKELAVHGVAIVVLAILAAGTVAGKHPLRGLTLGSRAVQLTIMALGWSIFTAALSTNRLISLGALGRVSALLLLFVVSIAVARRTGISYVVAAIVPAVINACLAIAQELSIWNPFDASHDTPHHIRTSALIGNPNDVGVYLALCALTSIVAAVVTRGRSRAAFAATTVALAAGLVASQTLTAIGAFVAGTVTLAIMISWKRAVSAIGLTALLLTLVVVAYQPSRTRFSKMTRLVRMKSYNALLTYRLTPFAAAVEMIRQRPIIGVGPGCFAWQYHPFKIEAEKRYPSLRTAYNRATNFGETHNDHLQVAAEFGIPGYVLLLGALAMVARVSLRRTGDGPVLDRTGRKAVREASTEMRLRFSRLLSLPLVICFVVLAATQFPLQLAVTSHLITTFAAICIAWSEG